MTRPAIVKAKKTRASIRAGLQPVPIAAPIDAASAGADPFDQSAAIVDAFARGKDPLTAALLARVAFAIRLHATGDK